MQDITYMDGTIRLRGKLAVSRGNLTLVPYPSNTIWVTGYQRHISQISYPSEGINHVASNRPTGDSYLRDQTVTAKNFISITLR
jgi:hypothetical protein